MIGLHFQEAYMGVKLAGRQLTILISQLFEPKKYGHFSVRASATRYWNYTQDMLKINLSLKKSTPNSIKYFLTNYFIGSY